MKIKWLYVFIFVIIFVFMLVEGIQPPKEAELAPTNLPDFNQESNEFINSPTPFVDITPVGTTISTPDVSVVPSSSPLSTPKPTPILPDVTPNVGEAIEDVWDAGDV